MEPGVPPAPSLAPQLLTRGEAGCQGGRDHPAHSVPPWKTVAEGPSKAALALSHPSNCLWGHRGCGANAKFPVLGLQAVQKGFALGSGPLPLYPF